MSNKMLIDASHPEETRVAVVKGNRVEEFDFESEHKRQIRGNIYLAKITRVEPSLQAAFVDYGGNRHGFLAFSEIHPDYYQIPLADRQALLDAEAEDARVAAVEETAEDDEDAGVDGDETPAPKKRRSRRSKKAAPAAETTNEESDDSEDEIGADNDGEDVVSEPASEPPRKPRRRTSRKKAEPEVEGVSTEAETPAEEAPVAEEKPKRARRSRVKKSTADADVDATAEAPAVVDTPEGEVAEAVQEKPKRRRRTARKNETEAEGTVEAKSDESASEEEGADANEDDAPAETPKRARRSRRSKSKSDTDSSNDVDAKEQPEETGGSDDDLEAPRAPRRSNRRHYKIQEVVKRRQIMLVQVSKEERGNKGAALTTYLSLAGRYSVLMPNTARGGGISRKITNASDRKRLKAAASQLDVPEGMGVILRTAGASRTPAEIQRDFEYLMRLWENVRTLTLESTAPCLVYEEGSLIKRSIRDLYDKDTSEIVVSGAEGYREAKDFMKMLMPSHARNVKQYKDRVPIFARSGVEAQLDAMLQPQVTLKSGGYLIINQTEALVAIDVNSGRSTRQHSVEETAVQTNLEAADEVGRQLRLRDLAGLIVIDFIDMDNRGNVRKVENRLKDALKNDRARIQVGRISHFGLMEMSRQRMRSSVLESTTQVCPTCEGLGHVRASSSVVLQVLRAIEEHLNKSSKNDLDVKVHTPTALHMLNSKRDLVSDLEQRYGVAITVGIDDHIGNVPCTIERGALATGAPVAAAVQVDAIDPDVEEDDDTSVETMTEPTPEQTSQPHFDDEQQDEGDGKKRRRRRRRRRGGSSSEDAEQGASGETESDTSEAPAAEAEPVAETQEEAPKSRRRRSRKKGPEADEVKAEEQAVEAVAQPVGEVADRNEVKPSRKRVTRKAPPSPQAEASAAATADDKGDEPPRRQRRNTSRVKADAKVTEADVTPRQEQSADEPEKAVDEAPDEKSKKKKGGWWQRLLD